MSTHGCFAAERKHDQPEKEPDRLVAEEVMTECGGSRGREVRGWRAEVEQRRRGGAKGLELGPPVGAGWFCLQNAGGRTTGAVLPLRVFRVEMWSSGFVF
jgi:hypothetical protein